MGYLAASLLATAIVVGQSSADWHRVSGQYCGYQQGLADGGLLQIVGMPGSREPKIALEQPGTRPKEWKSLKDIRISFGPGSEEAVGGSVGPAKEMVGRKIWAWSDKSAFLSELAGSTAIALSHDQIGSVHVPIKSAAAAASALLKCEDDRMREWGIDPIAWRSLSSPPIPLSPPNEWLTTNDFPIAAASFGVGGYVSARLDVGADGAIEGCGIVSKSKITAFEGPTCRALKKRGRFKPAINAQGLATAAPFMVHVRYLIPQ